MNCIVKADKYVNKKLFTAHVHNGSQEGIDIGNGFAIKFIAEKGEYVHIQLLDYGLGNKVATQNWVRTKKVIEKKQEEQITFTKNEGVNLWG
jgi:hypothetical protein